MVTAACSLTMLGALLAPVAASANARQCGTVHGPAGTVAMKVEVEDMTCKQAAAAIKSPKSPAELGYRCKQREQGSVDYYSCTRLKGGKVRFREHVQQGKV